MSSKLSFNWANSRFQVCLKCKVKARIADSGFKDRHIGHPTANLQSEESEEYQMEQ